MNPEVNFFLYLLSSPEKYSGVGNVTSTKADDAEAEVGEHEKTGVVCKQGKRILFI